MVVLLRVLFFTAIAGIAFGTARADSLDQWTLRSSGFALNLNAVAYGTNKFVAVGQAGTILVSTNHGTNWDFATSGVTNFLNGIAWAQNQFVAVGHNGAILTSPDAATWTPQVSPVTNNLNNVRFVSEQFMAVGAQGKILASTNGINWETRNSGTTHSLQGVAFGDGIFCAVGGIGVTEASITRSFDGIAWSTQNPGFINLHDIVYGHALFVAQGVRGQIYTSTTGTNWTLRQSGNVGYLYESVFAQGHFVAVGGGGGITPSQKIVTSSDGINWKLRPLTTGHSGPLQGVAYGNGYFVAVGQKGIILQSAPVFTLSAGEFPPNGELQWTLTGEVGRNYHFQFSENLGDTNWTDITNFISSGETTLLTDPAPDENARFYRVISP